MLVFLFRLLACLPLRAVHFCGAGAGWLAWFFSSSHRALLRANLAQVFDDKTAEKLLPQVIAASGKQIFELAWVWQRPLDEVLQKVRRVEGLALMEAAQAQQRSILLITPHIGCFELCAQYLAQHFGAMTVLYRPLRQKALEPVMRAGRGRGNVRLAAADGSGVRKMVRALRQGEMVGLLPDQVPRAGEGMWVDFFGRPAWTMTLAARLSQMDNVCVLFVRSERLARGKGFVLYLDAPDVALTGDLAARAEAINRSVEKQIRACPQQYLWAYARYKVPPGEQAPTGGDGSAQTDNMAGK